jgi:PAS domain S-box-containing protein
VLVEHAADAIVVLDPNGIIRFANPAARHIFGYPHHVLVGTDLVEHVHNDDRDAFTSALRTLGAGQLGHQMDLAFRTQARSGAWCLHDASIRNLMDDAHVHGLVLTARSVAAADETQEQLYQTQRLEAITRLAGGVAHDYNNLLTVVTGNAELLLLNPDIEDEARAELEEVAAAAGRAAALTRQLLAFSRQQVLRPERLWLADVVSSMESVIRADLGDAVALDMDLERDTFAVQVDPRQLHHVLVQLANNARDAMPNGGRLRIETDQVDVTADHAVRHAPMAAGTYGRLRVIDTGVGMDAATRARVFEPFFTSQERRAGTGLGLAMVYGIVKQSGGFIWVDSVPGSGSAFTVYFPVVKDQTPRQGPERSDTSSEGSGDSILVVDDEELVRRMTARTLRRVGYQVRVATGASEALLLARADGASIDLLLTDIVMPGMNGRELVDVLRAELPNLRVLLMSGYAHLRETFEAADEDTPFLQKPFTVDELLAKVRSVLAESTAKP